MKQLLIILLVLIMSSNVWAVTQIDIFSSEKQQFFRGYSFLPPYNPTTATYLDLGENLSFKLVRISSEENTPYRVMVQMELSVTIMDEGPHLDLTQWKHCTTEWRKAETITDSTFKLPSTENIDPECFPRVTVSEIREEVFKRGGRRWADLIKDNASINNYPIALALSSVRIKIEQKNKNKWEEVTIINFSIPMGC